MASRDILFSSWGGEIVDNRGKGAHAWAPADGITLPERLAQGEMIKALAGWQGLAIRSEEVDVVDLCRAHLEAVRQESKKCDKCNYCSTGYDELLEVFQDISKGEAREEDLEFLQSAAEAIQEAGKCSIGKAGPVPLLHALRFFPDDFLSAIRGERKVRAGNYHSGVTAPCVEACPIHLDIPRYIERIREAKFAESLQVIVERLPLPGVLGRVCFRPCEGHCRRANVDKPISIRALKRFVADQALAAGQGPEFHAHPSPRTGKVAIVGAGPAGMTCAFHLASRGHLVTIFEALAEPGGMSAVGIPDYRLPRGVLRGEVEAIQRLGVEIRYGQEVGKDVSLSEIEKEFDAVFIGIGAQRSIPMKIEGEAEGYRGFIPGLRYLREINDGRDPHPNGNIVAVIGGGNVAIDCARSSLRVGKKDVFLVYRRTRNEMPADPEEVKDAEDEGVRILFLTLPVRTVQRDGAIAGLECIRVELAEPDETGRPRPVPVEGSEFTLECDTVVTAIGQEVDLSALEGVDGLGTSGWGTLLVNEVTKQTSRPKLFAAGDCETGPDALIAACAGGRRAAESIDRLINGLPVEGLSEPHFYRLFKLLGVYDPNEKISKVECRERMEPVKLPPESRKGTFEEVEKVLATQDAVAEAERCLRCYYVATVAV